MFQVVHYIQMCYYLMSVVTRGINLGNMIHKGDLSVSARDF